MGFWLTGEAGTVFSWFATDFVHAERRQPRVKSFSAAVMMSSTLGEPSFDGQHQHADNAYQWGYRRLASF
jgi:hypothetical protein